LVQKLFICKYLAISIQPFFVNTENILIVDSIAEVSSGEWLFACTFLGWTIFEKGENFLTVMATIINLFRYILDSANFL